MKKFYISFLCWAITLLPKAQSINKIITAAEVLRIESVLASDSMQGRKSFTPDEDKASDFISNEFNKIGLTPLPGLRQYKQTFTMVSPKLINISASTDDSIFDSKNVIPFTSLPELTITEQSGFKKEYIKAGAQFRKEIGQYLNRKDNILFFVDPAFSRNFFRLTLYREHLFKSEKSIVFILGSFKADKYSIHVQQELVEEHGANVVGVIPGTTKKEEMVIFSGHYDHLGIEKADGNDSIYNGANDDASGITAIIEIARYYKAAKKNARTLIFAAFTAEEMGGFGSQYFSRQLNSDKVVAMVNMEMIGTESKWGKRSAYITGFEKSSLGKMLQKNLKGSTFSFYPDPYTEQDLFYRSDNATLARFGVPAHTISTSKMDVEPNYHKVTDEVSSLDMSNMTEIIKSVIVSARSIVNGRDKPSRVKADRLTR